MGHNDNEGYVFCLFVPWTGLITGTDLMQVIDGMSKAGCFLYYFHHVRSQDAKIVAFGNVLNYT